MAEIVVEFINIIIQTEPCYWVIARLCLWNLRLAGDLTFLAAEQIDQGSGEDNSSCTDAPDLGNLTAHGLAGADTDETGEHQKQHHSGDFDMNVMINNSLQFGLADDFTAVSLKDVVSRYVRLGLITNMDNVDEIMDLAWNPVLG